jgi:hypothetical protein
MTQITFSLGINGPDSSWICTKISEVNEFNEEEFLGSTM